MQDFIVSCISLHLSLYVSARSLSNFTFQVLWNHVTFCCKRVGMWNLFSCFAKPYTVLDLPLLV